MTKEETEGLEKTHDGEHHTYCSCGLGVDLTHEIGVGKVIETGHHHADDSGYRHCGNHTADWTLGQEFKVVSMCHSVVFLC